MKRFIRFSALLAIFASLLSCEDSGDASGKLKITVDKNYVQIGTDDVIELKAFYNDKDVTSETVFYIGIKALASSTFAPEETGVYEIWGNYGAENSDKVKVTAISVPVPSTPDDLNPSSTSFVPRVLFSQFTGVECGNCPRMIRMLHGNDGNGGLLHDEEVGDQIVWVAQHSYTTEDMAYLNSAYATKLGCTSYPCANIDYVYTADLSYGYTADEVKETFVKPYLAAKDGIAAGISVNSSLAGRQIIAKVTVKSAKDSEYRVGAFLLEDGIRDSQSGIDKNTEDWMSTHNACIRYVDAGGTNVFTGHSLGKIEAGDVMSYVFIWDLKSIWKEQNGALYWSDGLEYGFKEENLRMAVFVTAPNASGNYVINNVIECPVNGSLQFEYAE